MKGRRWKVRRTLLRIESEGKYRERGGGVTA